MTSVIRHTLKIELLSVSITLFNCWFIWLSFFHFLVFGESDWLILFDILVFDGSDWLISSIFWSSMVLIIDGVRLKFMQFAPPTYSS